jgi:acyl-CoA synthetase (AMP-forming)/AMP-acid ligase II
VRRVSDEQMASLDLRNWKIAFNGSEPVRAETLRRFSQKFAAAGFAPQAAFPCYGMAEATLFVSGPAASEAPALLDVSTTALENHRVVRVDTALPHTTLVGCGLGQLDQRIEIVHPDTLQACGPGDIGEIWLKGSHIARGYWNNPEASAECFGPRLAGTDDGGFFRTGDLGFIHQGDLFVTGRCKDLIIIAGRNLHPHDIEQQAAASHPLLQDCPSAAFSLDIDGAEKLVLVTETSTRRLSAADTQAVAMSVRKSIANHFDVALHQLVIVKPGGVPRTSSGKTQRQLCRQLHLRQSLPLITSDSPA